MGLIYVNPEGPNGKPDPSRQPGYSRTFRRMAMNDEETVALIRRSHFGKTHGAGDAKLVGAEPEAATIEEAGPGLEEQVWHWQRGRLDRQRPGSHLDHHAYEVEQNFFTNLFSYEWELTKSPAGAHQWKPKNGSGNGTVPDAHDASKRHAPSMLTTDLGLRFDPAYEEISRRFLRASGPARRRVCPGVVQTEHRDMGPIVRYLGRLFRRSTCRGKTDPAVNHPLIGSRTLPL